MFNSPDSVINVTCLFLSTNPLRSCRTQQTSPFFRVPLRACYSGEGLLAAGSPAFPATEGGYWAKPPPLRPAALSPSAVWVNSPCCVG